MGVRNCKEIGENLQKISSRLMANDKLVNLLYYTGKDPLNQPSLSEEQKKQEVFEKLIKVLPRVGPKETAHSVVAIVVENGTKISSNDEFRTVRFSVDTLVPLTQWFIKDTNLRPFAIMGEIQDSLVGKKVNGLGKIDGGDFELKFVTDEVVCYTQTFYIVTYE